jgi:hypothetical protein
VNLSGGDDLHDALCVIARSRFAARGRV